MGLMCRNMYLGCMHARIQPLSVEQLLPPIAAQHMCSYQTGNGEEESAYVAHVSTGLQIISPNAPLSVHACAGPTGLCAVSRSLKALDDYRRHAPLKVFEWGLASDGLKNRPFAMANSLTPSSRQPMLPPSRGHPHGIGMSVHASLYIASSVGPWASCCLKGPCP